MKKLTTYLLSAGLIFATASAMSVAASAEETPTYTVQVKGITLTGSDGKEGTTSNFTDFNTALEAITKAKATGSATITLKDGTASEDDENVIVYSTGSKVALPKDLDVTITSAKVAGKTVVLDASAAKSIAANASLTLQNITLKGSDSTKLTVKKDLTLDNAHLSTLASVKGSKGTLAFKNEGATEFAFDLSGFATVTVPKNTTVDLVGGAKKGATFDELALSDATSQVNIYDKVVTANKVSGKGKIGYVDVTTLSEDSETTTKASYLNVKKDISGSNKLSLAYYVRTDEVTEEGTETGGLSEEVFPEGRQVIVSGDKTNAVKDKFTLSTAASNGVNYTISTTKKNSYVRPVAYSLTATGASANATAATWDEVKAVIEEKGSSSAKFTVTLLADTDVGGALKMPKKDKYDTISFVSGKTARTIPNTRLKDATEVLGSYEYFFETGTETKTYYAANTSGSVQRTRSSYTATVEDVTTYTASTSNVAASATDTDYAHEITDTDLKTKLNAATGIVPATHGAVANRKFYPSTDESKAGKLYYVTADSGTSLYEITVAEGKKATLSSSAAPVDVGRVTLTELADGDVKTAINTALTNANISGDYEICSGSDGNYYVASKVTLRTQSYTAYPLTLASGDVLNPVVNTAAAGAKTITETIGDPSTFSDGTATYTDISDSDTVVTNYTPVATAQLAFTGGLSADGNLVLENIVLKGYKYDKKNDVKNGVAFAIKGKNGVTLTNVSAAPAVTETVDAEDEEEEPTVNVIETASSISAISAGTLTLNGNLITTGKITANTLDVNKANIQIQGQSMAFKTAVKGTGSASLSFVDKKGAALTSFDKVKITVGSYGGQFKNFSITTGEDDDEVTTEYTYAFSGKNLVISKTDSVYSLTSSNASANIDGIQFLDLKSIGTYITTAIKNTSTTKVTASDNYTITLPNKFSLTKFDLPKAKTYKTLTLEADGYDGRYVEASGEGDDAVEAHWDTLNITPSALKLTGNLVIDESINLSLSDKIKDAIAKQKTKDGYTYTDNHAAKVTDKSNELFVDALEAFETEVGFTATGSPVVYAATTKLTATNTAESADIGKLYTALTEAVAGEGINLSDAKTKYGENEYTPKVAKEHYDAIAAAVTFVNSDEVTAETPDADAVKTMRTNYKALSAIAKAYVDNGKWNTYSYAAALNEDKTNIILNDADTEEAVSGITWTEANGLVTVDSKGKITIASAKAEKDYTGTDNAKIKYTDAVASDTDGKAETTTATLTAKDKSNNTLGTVTLTITATTTWDATTEASKAPTFAITAIGTWTAATT